MFNENDVELLEKIIQLGACGKAYLTILKMTNVDILDIDIPECIKYIFENNFNIVAFGYGLEILKVNSYEHEIAQIATIEKTPILPVNIPPNNIPIRVEIGKPSATSTPTSLSRDIVFHAEDQNANGSLSPIVQPNIAEENLSPISKFNLRLLKELPKADDITFLDVDMPNLTIEILDEFIDDNEGFGDDIPRANISRPEELDRMDEFARTVGFGNNPSLENILVDFLDRSEEPDGTAKHEEPDRTEGLEDELPEMNLIDFSGRSEEPDGTAKHEEPDRTEGLEDELPGMNLFDFLGRSEEPDGSAIHEEPERTNASEERPSQIRITKYIVRHLVPKYKPRKKVNSVELSVLKNQLTWVPMLNKYLVKSPIENNINSAYVDTSGKMVNLTDDKHPQISLDKTLRVSTDKLQTSIDIMDITDPNYIFQNADLASSTAIDIDKNLKPGNQFENMSAIEHLDRIEPQMKNDITSSTAIGLENMENLLYYDDSKPQIYFQSTIECPDRIEASKENILPGLVLQTSDESMDIDETDEQVEYEDQDEKYFHIFQDIIDGKSTDEQILSRSTVAESCNTFEIVIRMEQKKALHLTTNDQSKLKNVSILQDD